MFISSVIAALKDVVFPVLGTVMAISLISFIPRAADNKDEE